MVAKVSVMTSSARARSVGGRALKCQCVGGNKLSLGINHLGVLTRASKLNINDKELFECFHACLQGREKLMACMS
jgi:hypothetical protein